jgi:hypothetical protein
VRDVRELLRYRAALVSLRTGLKNKVHAVLTKNGMECSWSNVLGKKSRQWLETLPLRPCYRQELHGYIRLAEVLTILIVEITVRIKQLVSASPQARLLMTIPGVSYYSALLILSELERSGASRVPSTCVLTPAWSPVCTARAVNLSLAGSPSKAPAGCGGSVSRSVSMRPTEMPDFRVCIVEFYGAGD